MKRIISWLLILTMSLSFLPAATASAEGTDPEEVVLVLPDNTKEIGEEAFAGDSAFTTLIIPKYVEKIGVRAFANCSGLREVYFGNNENLQIATNAFEGCGDIHFYAFPFTPGELFALSHGYAVDLLEDGGNFLQRAMELIANNGGSTVLQSGEFASKRLILKYEAERLPDISAFQPNEIIHENTLFIIQFDTVDDTIGCYTLLCNDPKTVFVEADECVETGEIQPATENGVTDPGVWDTDDPMGFDEYASFVAQNGIGTVTIAIVDSGVRKLASYSSKLRSDGINMLKAQDGEEWYTDHNVHGSVIASIINDCTGSANVMILPVRVVGAAGTTDYVLLGNGIKYAVEKGAKIINLSMNFKDSAYVKYCIEEATKAGVTVVVAAGNSSRNTSNVFPANLSSVVTVSGIDKTYKLSATSNYGTDVDYCAPDSHIKTSAFPNVNQNGTSFAAPMIASAFALNLLDPYHDLDDLDSTCFLSQDTDSPANSYGKGMPRVNELANIVVTDLYFDGSMPDILNVGDEIELRWTALPENATDKTVTASSSNENVIGVRTDGSGKTLIRARATGTAVLTLTANNGGVSVSRTFSVVQPVIKIQIFGAEDKLPLGHTMQLRAEVSPSNASNPNVEWVSTDTTIATVSQSGLVTPVAEGTVGIFARAKDGSGVTSNTATIEVVNVPDAEGIILTVDGKTVTNGTIQMVPGEAKKMDVKILPEDADQTVKITAAGSSISVDSNGVITAISSGVGLIYVVTEDSTVSATLQVEVVIKPISVTISGETTIDEGQSTTLSAEVSPSNATDKTVTWTSSNTNVATVNNGTITGKTAGVTVITATANGDNSVYAQVTVTVRHPFTINFDLNADGDSTATMSQASMLAYSGFPVGVLPGASRDFYDLEGWYTEATGGTKITENSSIDISESSITLFAHWDLHPESDWVLTSQVPSNAVVTQTSYSYRESTESLDANLSGWVANGFKWKENGTGWAYYASFPDSFNKSHAIYKEYRKEPYAASETETTKREVSNVQDGWIYWHWMYNVRYASGTTRAISYKKGTYGSSNFYYGYFYAMASTTDCPYLDKNYCNGQNKPSYNAKSVVNKVASSADKENSKSGLGTDRFFRTNRYKSTYTDYLKYYLYYRDLEFQPTDPGDGDNISNKVVYVKYRLR